MNFQDWNEVKWDKRNEKKDISNVTKLNNAIRSGLVTTRQKTGNLNKAGSSGVNTVVNQKKLEKEEETFKHQKVSLNMSKRIAQARNEKKLTQKDLANGIFVPLKTIQDYESSKAIPNHIIINKMEKFLNCRLRD
jgi:putative transcription factor